MNIIEYESLDPIFEKMDIDPNFVCNINRDLDLKVSKQNGYKIFSITLDKDDPFFEPEEFNCMNYHGLRIYTCLYGKFKDCKSVAIPFWRFSDKEYKDEYDELGQNNLYNVYVGNGYANILCYGQDLDIFNYKGFDQTKYGVLIISDGMYSTRYNSLVKLLSIIA